MRTVRKIYTQQLYNVDLGLLMRPLLGEAFLAEQHKGIKNDVVGKFYHFQTRNRHCR